MSEQVIVIGGGLAGLSAAHTCLQAGQSVCMIDKKAFMGGNSTKATSGINGAGTNTQKKLNIPDSAAQFEEDTVRSGTGVKKGPCPKGWPLAKVLADGSAPGVHWIQDNFGLALDQVSRLGGHFYPRTHRSGVGGKFPGMEITYALIKRFEECVKKDPSKAKFINRARVNKLLQDSTGKVNGIEYTTRDGKTKTEMGSAVVIATGGFGAGVLDKKSLLARVRPELMHLPTTNGDHCTGDGIDIAVDIGAEAIGLSDVQVHPTGLVNPKYPNARTRFLAAGALRGEGGILLDRNGKRFCNDLGTRDYVTGKMWENQGPFRLVLNSKAASGIAWHCKHYTGRGVMKKFASAADLAKEMGIPTSNIKETFDAYNGYAKNGNDPWGKPAFHCKSTPYEVDDKFFVAVVDPIVHYTMGGLKISAKTEVMSKTAVIPGLFACGEVAGGVHGRNRLGGSALGECVVLGRVSGNSVLEYLGASAGASGGKKEYTAAEVAKHNTKDDCWVIVNGEVLDVTTFLADHPGGEMAIMTFAGRDATEEFNMLHDSDVVEKYAPECIIGTFKPSSKL